MDGIGKKFYYANKEKEEMIEISQEQFEERFECYEADLKEYNGIRPWLAIPEQKDKKEDVRKESQEGEKIER